MDGFHDSIDLVAGMWTWTVIRTPPMIGLPTPKASPMHSQTTPHNGTTLTMTDLGTIPSTSTDLHGVLPTEVMDVEPRMDCQHLTDGGALIRMKTVGPIQHRIGSQARADQAMPGQKIQRNGTIVMVTDAEITRLEQLRMFALRNLGPQWGQVRAEIVGGPDTDGDGWSNLGDAFIHEPTQWRDTDGDGYGDEADGNEADACPNIRGTSILDRLGCRDTDGDGWSDPTDDWAAHPYGMADAFPTEALQWKDTDSDGFGDVPLGALRDDCPDVFGTSTRDLQGCEDNNGDGWSNEYGEWNAALAIMGEDPAASWLTYLIIGVAFILGASAALIVRSMRSDEEKMLTEEMIGLDGNQAKDLPSLESEMLPLPELAIPLPPPPGGDQDA